MVYGENSSSLIDPFLVAPRLFENGMENAMTKNLTHIGNQIRLERQRSGITQAALAQTAGVSKGRIEAIENDRYGDIGVSTLAAILNATGLGLAVFPLKQDLPADFIAIQV